MILNRIKLVVTNIIIIFFVVFTIPTFVFAREQIKAVGSATVYPFATIIAETFNYKNPQFKTPVIESTGTGGGMNLFCQGLGERHPDITNASRKIKDSEISICNKNKVLDIKEIKLGYDAIVIIHPNSMKTVNFTEEDLFLALAEKTPDINGNLVYNPYKKWSDIDKELPNTPIKVMGPPSGSGTRDSFVELVMKVGCENLQKHQKFKASKNEITRACLTIRSDGPWSTGGENYTLLINKVSSSQDLFAILGYSFYEQNQSLISAAKINNFAPNHYNLTNKLYPLFRPLFIYAKGEHLNIVPGLHSFIKEIVNINTIGNQGYLTKHGIIPLSKDEYTNMINHLNLK